MDVKLDQSPSNSCSGSPAKKVQEGVFQSEFLNFIIEGAAAGGKMSKEEPSLARCLQCQEPKPVLKYVIPTLAGQKSFCSEPCLMNYKRGKFTVYVRLVSCLSGTMYVMSLHFRRHPRTRPGCQAQHSQVISAERGQ